jgi:hypothetical protein
VVVQEQQVIPSDWKLDFEGKAIKDNVVFHFTGVEKVKRFV